MLEKENPTEWQGLNAEVTRPRREEYRESTSDPKRISQIVATLYLRSEKPKRII